MFYLAVSCARLAPHHRGLSQRHQSLRLRQYQWRSSQSDGGRVGDDGEARSGRLADVVSDSLLGELHTQLGAGAENLRGNIFHHIM